jgi:hypothetical protein
MDVYQILLVFHNGLPYRKCRQTTNEQVTSPPHVIMTSDVDWDPTTCNNGITDIIAFYDASIVTVHCCNFDDHGNFHHHIVATHTLHAELHFFDVHEYPDYLNLVDDILDAHNQIYKFQVDG